MTLLPSHVLTLIPKLSLLATPLYGENLQASYQVCPHRFCPKSQLKMFQVWAFTWKWDKQLKSRTFLVQESQTTSWSLQIYVYCWKIALGNDVDQRSKFSVKINFSSEQSKIGGTNKILRCFISFLLTFFNMYHSHSCIWVKLTQKHWTTEKFQEFL